MRNDVMAYMRYYNLARLHTANGELSPAEYEQTSLRKCPQLVAQNSMFIPGMRDRYTCVLMKATRSVHWVTNWAQRLANVFAMEWVKLNKKALTNAIKKMDQQ